MTFNIIDKENKFKLGNIITSFKLDNIDREFILFSVSDFDDDNSDLCVAYLNKDSEGFDYIEEIEDEKIFTKAMGAVRDIIKTIS